MEPINYTGTIIEESLKDKTILKQLKILSTKVEPVTEKHKTPWLSQWTLHKVEIEENKAEDFANILSHEIETSHSAWYIDYKNDKWHFIIYPNKVFKIDLYDGDAYKKAKEHGISLGIPEYQVDFAPKDKVWKR